MRQETTGATYAVACTAHEGTSPLAMGAMYAFSARARIPLCAHTHAAVMTSWGRARSRRPSPRPVARPFFFFTDERVTIGVGATIVVGVAAGSSGDFVGVVVTVDGAGVVSEGGGVHVQGEVAA